MFLCFDTKNADFAVFAVFRSARTSYRTFGSRPVRPVRAKNPDHLYSLINHRRTTVNLSKEKKRKREKGKKGKREKEKKGNRETGKRKREKERKKKKGKRGKGGIEKKRTQEKGGVSSSISRTFLELRSSFLLLNFNFEIFSRPPPCPLI